MEKQGKSKTHEHKKTRPFCKKFNSLFATENFTQKDNTGQAVWSHIC